MARKRTRKVEAVISAMGALLAIVVDLVTAIRELGGNVGECLYRLSQPEGKGTLQAIARLLVETSQPVTATATIAKEAVSQYLTTAHNVIVDFSQNLEQMIVAGCYNWKNDNITANHFPIMGSGKQSVLIELLWFNQYFKDGDEVIAKLAEVNAWLTEQKAGYKYRWATIAELLALGIAFPDLQRQFPIGALGSIWHPTGRRLFACLGRSGAGRYLRLCSLELGFDDFWRFAVVREQSC
ncbi:MAG: hypothetical protein WCT16_01655 [Candidatus Buchananbacteria bacterium]